MYPIETMHDAIKQGQIDKIQAVLQMKYHFDPVNQTFSCDRIVAEKDTIISMLRDLKTSNEAIVDAIDDKENGVSNGLSSIGAGIALPFMAAIGLILPIGFTCATENISNDLRNIRYACYGIIVLATAGGGFGMVRGAQLIKNAGPADDLRDAQKEIDEKSKLFFKQLNTYCDEHRIKLSREVQTELWSFEDFLKKD